MAGKQNCCNDVSERKPDGAKRNYRVKCEYEGLTPSYIHTSFPQPSLAYCRNGCLLPTLRFAGTKLRGTCPVPHPPSQFFF